jgi:hypothetical protein
MPADEPGKTGLGPQFGRTRAAFTRLITAHVALLRAELTDIVAQLKVLGTIAGIVLVLALLTAETLYIGGFLFVGEWLFGSIGWGLAHGVLFALGLIIVLVLVALGAGRGGVAVGFLISAGLTVALALALGSNVKYDTATYLASQLPAPLDSAGAIAALAGALGVAVLLLLVGWRLGGGSGAIAGLVVGLLIGAPLGWLAGGAPWTWPPAVGMAIAIGLLIWPILQLAISGPRLDVSERFSRLYPRQSIDAATETKEWLEEQWQTRRPKRDTK